LNMEESYLTKKILFSNEYIDETKKKLKK